MIKRIHSAITIILIAIILSGCGLSSSNSDALEGYWMNEYGSTVTFTGDGAVMWFGRSLSYTIYDGDKVLIKDGDTEVGNYAFSVKSEELQLTDLGNGIVNTLYGKESKQQKILDDIRAAQDEIIEAEKCEEEKRLENNIIAEWESEVEMLENYQEYCRHQIDSGIDVEFNKSEIGYVQERLDILKSRNRERINEDSFIMTKTIICNNVLPDNVANDEKTIFVDDGYNYLFDDSDDVIIGYTVEVRTDNGDVAPIYGYYAVQFSTNTVYTIDVASDFWYPLISTPLPSE